MLSILCMREGEPMLRKACPITFAAVLILVFSMASPAGAAMKTYDFTFNSSDFTPYLGSPVPTDPVSGSLIITFDELLTYNDTPLASLNINIPLDSEPGFNYSSAAKILTIGGLQHGVDTFYGGTNDFMLVITKFTTFHTFEYLKYARAGIGDLWSTSTGSFMTSPVPPPPPPPTPLPGAILLLGTGLALAVWPFTVLGR